MKRSRLNVLSKRKCYKNMLLKSGNNSILCTEKCSDCEKPHYFTKKKIVKINLISIKKRKEIQDEIKVRKQLRERSNGYCEICGRHESRCFGGLHPHEWKMRSLGGKMTLDNSSLLCNTCQGNHGHRLKIKEY